MCLAVAHIARLLLLSAELNPFQQFLIPRTLSNYMMWTFVRSVVPYLSRDFRSALLDYQKEMEGKKSAETRWLSCLDDINSYSHGLTFALGYMWVSKVFDSDVIPLVSEKRYITSCMMRLVFLFNSRP